MTETRGDSIGPDDGGAGKFPVAVVYVASLALCAAVPLARRAGWNAAPFPYAWWDVAVVCIVCGVPLAAWLAAVCRTRIDRRATATLGALLLGLAAAAFTLAGEQAVSLTANAVWLSLIRVVPPFLLTAALALVASALLRRTRSRAAPVRPPQSAAAAGLLGAVILAAAPLLYVEARCRSDAGRLASLIEQSRLGDAAALARGMLLLKPEQEFDERPLRRVAAGLDSSVRQLEASVAVPLAKDATDEQRVERARELAMLGREDEALAVLDQLERPNASVEALNLRGTIHETREEWELAGASFARSRAVAAALPESPEQQAGLADAIRGDAYAKRRLGRNAEAEAAYLEMLAVAPTADTHFLLAQFYEDTQQSAEARRHARAAMALAPGRYDAAAETLIDRLMTVHFGCGGVFLAERESEVRQSAVQDAPAADEE